jgi:hypothetical protein
MNMNVNLKMKKTKRNMNVIMKINMGTDPNKGTDKGVILDTGYGHQNFAKVK